MDKTAIFNTNLNKFLVEKMRIRLNRTVALFLQTDKNFLDLLLITASAAKLFFFERQLQLSRSQYKICKFFFHFLAGDRSLLRWRLVKRSQKPGRLQIASGLSLAGLARSMRSPKEKLRSFRPPMPQRWRSWTLWCGPGTQFLASAIRSEYIFSRPQAVYFSLSPPGTSRTSQCAGGLCSEWNSAQASERCLMKFRSYAFHPSPKVFPILLRRGCSSVGSMLYRSGAGFSLALRRTTSEMGLRCPLPKVQLLAGLSDEGMSGSRISEQARGLSRKRSWREKLYLCAVCLHVAVDWFHCGCCLGRGRWEQLGRTEEPGRPSGEKWVAQEWLQLMWCVEFMLCGFAESASLINKFIE